MTEATNLKAGVRIRERRLDRGVRQADLAAEVEISPSYLNLIEHNRRRIGGALLAKLARALDVEPAFLSEGADRAVLDKLRGAATTFADVQAELDRTEDMAARYPGWAGLIAAQATRLDGLERQVQILTDRMAHDPALAASLHGVISAVTSIRSTAAILTSDETVDADWQGRFHRNIHDDSVRLAAQSDALMAYLETPEEMEGLRATPIEEMETWLAQSDFHFPALEAGGDVAGVMRAANDLRPTARHLLSAHLTQYASDAAMMPLAAFVKAARATQFDPLAMAHDLDIDLAAVMRRLATLPKDGGNPPMGLVICDSGGFVRFLRQVPGFAMPRLAACPLWPVYTALGQVGRVLCHDVILSGAPEMRMRCTAIAQYQTSHDYSRPPLGEATMLVVPDVAPVDDVPIPLGVACRICPRRDCRARREPSALADGL